MFAYLYPLRQLASRHNCQNLNLGLAGCFSHDLCCYCGVLEGRTGANGQNISGHIWLFIGGEGGSGGEGKRGGREEGRKKGGRRGGGERRGESQKRGKGGGEGITIEDIIY